MLISGSNHLSRNGRLPTLMDTYQPPRTRSNHMRLEESHRSEEERAEKINSDLEKMIQFMTILGQVDRYLSSRAKSFVSTLGRAMENNPDDHHLYNDKDMSLDYWAAFGIIKIIVIHKFLKYYLFYPLICSYLLILFP